MESLQKLYYAIKKKIHAKDYAGKLYTKCCKKIRQENPVENLQCLNKIQEFLNFVPGTFA